MKKMLSLILTSLLAASILASCATDPLLTSHSSLLTSTSSATCADRAWLESRIGEVPDSVTVGLASDLGIDMTAFEDDGYIIRTTDGETVVAGKTSDGLDRAVRAFAKAYASGKSVPDATYHEGYRIERFTIAGRDISEYTVVYEGGTSPTIGQYGYTRDNSYYAASQFCQLTEKACGVKLPISSKDAAHMIKITYITDGSHGENGFTYEVKDGDLLIHGAPEALGCGNAVWYFFENECGWDALIYGDADLREADHLDVPEGTKADVDPMFDSLYLFENRSQKFKYDRFGTGYVGRVFQGQHGMETYKWGGHWTTNTHPCYTDEGFLENVCADIYDYLVANPDAAWADISMNDSYTYCHCKKCSAVMKEENGALAGPVVRWANAIDEYIRGEFPDRDIKLPIYAYAGTNAPPVTAPNENIYVTYCTNGCCTNHCIDGSENCDPTFDFVGVMGNRDFSNADYAEWIRGWCALSDNIYVWHYGLDGVVNQYTQYHNLYEDVHFFADCGARGFMYEAEQYGLGEGRLRLQEIMMMQFHPEWTRADYDAAVSDLYEREFGDGGEYILAYTKNCWNKAQLAAGCWDCWEYSDYLNPQYTDYPTFHALEEKSMLLLDTAISLANNEKQQKAAELFSCDFLYKRCCLNYYRALDAGDTDTIAALEDTFALFRERMTDCGYPARVMNISKIMYFQPTLAEEAEVNWSEFRGELTDPAA